MKSEILNPKTAENNKGFSLIELVIVLAIAAILGTLAVPNFNTLILNNRMQTPINELTQAILLARNEAIKTGLPVYLCPSNNAQANRPTCTNNRTRWGRGILAFQKPANSIAGISVYDRNNDRLIKQIDIEYRGTAISEAGIPALFGFQNNGLTLPTGTELDIAICDDRGEDAGFLLTITTTGKTRRKQGDVNDPINDCTP